MITADEFADWVLSKIDREAGDTISPLKLQKLLYYGQAWHLAIFNEPLFEERIEAWRHGPVVPSLYNKYREICKNCDIPIESLPLQMVELIKESEELLTEVLSIYGEHSASYLEELTHSEQPWIEARGGLPPFVNSSNEISKLSMTSFYRQMHGQQTPQ